MTAATPSKKGGRKGKKGSKDDSVTNGDASPEAGHGDGSAPPLVCIAADFVRSLLVL